ncbi:MAG TPA: restriction endonuclease [Bacteroidales bacterium]|nr:restriction endonuclease [Bacteroidales bacterium]
MNYPSIQIFGNIISPDLLTRLDSDDNIAGQKPKDFNLDSSVKVRDEISQAWSLATSFYKGYKLKLSKLSHGQSGESENRSIWIGPLLSLMGYNIRYEKSAQTVLGKTYHITDPAENMDNFPVIIVGSEQDLDKKPYGLRMSPHALLQEYLNNNEPFLYGLVTNGKVIRLLRDSGRIIRLSYLEVDLERMFDEGLYADFAVLFRLLHASRMPQKQHAGPECLMETYHLDALESGTRIREKLSEAVENAIRIFGTGFLNFSGNEELRQAIKLGNLNAHEYYRYLLRLIYRLLFLMVIEERNLVYPNTNLKEIRRLRDIYYKYYGLGRLRNLTRNNYSKDSRYSDLWLSLQNTFLFFENKKYGDALKIQPLNGDLFGDDALGIIGNCGLDNKTFLNALQNLSWFTAANGTTQPINYKLLNVEEFGSVYEGLLEYDPDIKLIGSHYTFDFVAGTKRSREGAHYTPEELVQPLIKHSLDYLLEDREKLIKKDIEQKKLRGESQTEAREKIVAQHLLSLKVADVACGSGHILLSAARRIADRYAALVEESDQPTPTATRAAIKLVIRHCIYGVDKNPLAVELCKVALWLESHNPGEPLNFLDHHIKCGDSIVGLVHREELDKGIPDEAFKALTPEEKSFLVTARNEKTVDVTYAAYLAKQNRMERVSREVNVVQLKTDFEATTGNSVNEAMADYRNFNNLPEKTPEEIAIKQKAYKKFVGGKGYTWLKAMADTQVAQFFIPKTEENQGRLMTDAEFRTILSGYAGWQNMKTAKAVAVAQEKKFFHWFIEFPEVFQDGGFDCILGNPPFLGDRRLKEALGENFLEWIRFYFTEGATVDLVVYFLLRINSILKEKGYQSLISTNTLAQGKAREFGLEKIIANGSNLNHAVKSMKWPGLAAVEVSLITIFKGGWKGKFYLNGKETNQISPFLDEADNTGTPFPLFNNDGKSYQGSIILGLGFVLKQNEAEKLISVEPKNSEVIQPYLNGDDLNSNPSQNPSRYVINFFDWSIEKASEYKEVYKLVEEKVKPERTRWKEDKDGNPIIGEYALRHPLPVKWWQHCEKRPALYNATKHLNRVLVSCRVSKYVNQSFVKVGAIFDVATSVVIRSEYWEYAFLQSTLHNLWAWKYGSTMKFDIRYTNRDCIDTFPILENLPIELQNKIDSIGETYHEHRRQLMLSMQLGLTKTYNAFHAKEIQPGITSAALQGLNKQAIEKQYGKEVWNLWNHLQKTPAVCTIEEAIAGIVKLRELHVEMDNAVLEAYGWANSGVSQSPVEGRAGIDLRHDFYEVDYLPENDRIRYTIHPEARKEILKRLLELNHKIHEEEVAAGLWEKKKNKEYKNKKSPGQQAKEPEGGYGGLFDTQN